MEVLRVIGESVEVEVVLEEQIDEEARLPPDGRLKRLLLVRF